MVADAHTHLPARLHLVLIKNSIGYNKAAGSPGGFAVLFGLFHRDNGEFKFKTLAAVDFKLLENVGAAACRARASGEAVNVDCYGVLVVQILLMLCFLKQLLGVIPCIEIEVAALISEFEAVALVVGECEVPHFAAVASILRSDIRLMHLSNGGVIYADDRLSVKVAQVLFLAHAVVLNIAKALGHLKCETESRHMCCEQLVTDRLKQRLYINNAVCVYGIDYFDLSERSDALGALEAVVNGHNCLAVLNRCVKFVANTGIIVITRSYPFVSVVRVIVEVSSVDIRQEALESGG